VASRKRGPIVATVCLGTVATAADPAAGLKSVFGSRIRDVSERALELKAPALGRFGASGHILFSGKQSVERLLQRLKLFHQNSTDLRINL